MPGEKNADPMKALMFLFNEAMQTESFGGFTVTDSSGEQVTGQISWQNPMEVHFQPDPVFQSRMYYQVHLAGKMINDMAGNRLADTAYAFITFPIDTLTEISGEVTDPDSSAEGYIYVSAVAVKNTQNRYRTGMESPGSYVLRQMLPGDYFLQAFRDRDGNGRYTYGSVTPYTPAERFVQLPDTIRIRSRWPNEGNNLRLPWEETD
jgi:hypothetical protein